MIFDGTNKPGVNQFLVENLQTAKAYNFYLVAVNYNGAGPKSPIVKYFSCLPPQQILPPKYVTSTELTLTVSWGAP